MNQKPRTARSWQAMKNNAQGGFFEGYIKAACQYYRAKGMAKVEKVPEPFKVTETHRDGTFTGRFTANAQPDFMGTLRGGRSICFEAKYTSTDKIKQSVLTQEQQDSLEEHWAAGAKAGVCVGIGNVFGFVPWGVWRNLKGIFGHKHMTAEDLEPYRVKFNGCCLFLDYIHQVTEKTTAQGMAEAVRLDELETSLWKVLGKDTAQRVTEIIKQQERDKWEAFMETTLEAAMGGADYSKCQNMDDVAGIYAAWLIDKHF